MTAAIMFQGTGSDVGKSLIVTGLARLFARQGLVVRPFKPQNMSNNAAPAIAPDGFYGEIGRAQALQARAAGLDPTTDMNPVLLKPQTDIGAQVIVDGRVIGNAEARAYHAMKPDLLPPVLAAFDRLSEGADLILVEGAGSPAEVNLRAGDIANMGFAEAADIPVVLIGDIERGGVIASLVGTHALLTPGEQVRLSGYIINRFRGDVSLFDDALPIIAARTGLDSLGIVPWFESARALPAEDTASLEDRYRGQDWSTATIRIAVPRLPRIANFDDLDPAGRGTRRGGPARPPGREPAGGRAISYLLAGLQVHTRRPRRFAAPRLGRGHSGGLRNRGAHIMGICGGYQMLGRSVADPGRDRRRSAGDDRRPGVCSTSKPPSRKRRRLSPATGHAVTDGTEITGFEMHMGTHHGAWTPCIASGQSHLTDGQTERRDRTRRACQRHLHPRPVRVRRTSVTAS